MAFDQDMDLIERVRAALGGKGDLVERKMFGGFVFVLNGKICMAVRDHQLLAHVRPEQFDSLLKEPGTHPMVERDHEVKGAIFVERAYVEKDAELQKWIDRALEHNAIVSAKK